MTRRGELTVVLVHGAGHDAAVWDATRAALRSPSIAVDLPGRGRHPADITTVTVAEAAAAVVADVLEAVTGDVVLVAHSIGATVLPAVAARLAERVRHLVFVAGVTAREGERPMASFLEGREAEVEAGLAKLRDRYRGSTLEVLDAKTAGAIDSLNFAAQTLSWSGVPSTGRTFVRCLRDPIQPRDLQARFASDCGATAIVDIDSGHTPALDAPAELARLLDAIVEQARGEAVSPSSG